MAITRLTQTDYDNLILHTTPLKVKGDFIDVVLTKDNYVVKHCYQRGLCSSSSLWPYGIRFKKNSERLLALGLQVPQVEAIYYYPEKNCYIVIYPFIPGNTLRKNLETGNLESLEKFAKYIAQLHQLGIYFRDLNTGNCIEQPNFNLAMIDIASVKIAGVALPPNRRAKNISCLLKNHEDKPFLFQFGIDRFINIYLQATEMLITKKQQFIYPIQAISKCLVSRLKACST